MLTRQAVLLAATCLCALGSALAAAGPPRLVPLPHAVRALPGRPWRLPGKMSLRTEGSIPDAREHLAVAADALKRLADTDVRIGDGAGPADVVVAAEPALSAEAYRLRVRPEGVRMEASTLKGLAHATATLLQLIGQCDGRTVPALDIDDRPDCPYRSFMVDLGRNPHSLPCLKETIDLLWFYKVDSLHLHLTDDQRFAFPSRAYPKLVTRKGMIPWQQFAELERYARIRGVTIIPELEVPGHSSILRRVYPEVFGKRPADLAASATARKAVKVLLDEMIELFASTPYVHIGGDEAYGVPVELQRALINDLHAHLKAKGRQALVWEGPPPGGGKDMVHTDVIHLNWRTVGFPADRMIAAGYRVVNAAWDPLYIVDHYPRNNFTMASPQYVYETLQLTKFQHFNPHMPTFARPVRTPRSDRLIGFCMPWWEGREQNFARMCFPRVVAMAEVAWNHDQQRSWRAFAAGSAAAERTRQRAFYPVEIAASPLAVPEDGVFHNQVRVRLRTHLRGGRIRYTLDGSEPAADSSLHHEPLTLTRSTVVRAALFRDGRQVSHASRKLFTCVRPVANLALGKPVRSNRTSGRPFSVGRLTDGGTGPLDYYLAYPAQPEPVEVTVDLGAPTTINRVTVHAFSTNRAYESYRVLVSADGREFSQVADRLQRPARPTPFVRHDFPPRGVRYIRIESHGCKGNVFESFSRLVEIQAFHLE